METVIVAAVGRNGVIGVDGSLPWRIPEDLARFKALTMGNVLIMGRATFDSIGRPLPGRKTIVLTRNRQWTAEGVGVAHSLGEALNRAEAAGLDAYVVGGAAVYAVALEVADRLEITEVDAAPDGDTYFPDVDWSRWREVSRDSRDGYAFVTYEAVAVPEGAGVDGDDG